MGMETTRVPKKITGQYQYLGQTENQKRGRTTHFAGTGNSIIRHKQ
jgi:hypothetical protein